jgi:hypothetical protein
MKETLFLLLSLSQHSFHPIRETIPDPLETQTDIQQNGEEQGGSEINDKRGMIKKERK